ncbi:MAG: ribosome biogenesis GTPase Der [Thermoleophilia bacterium]|nr:ribosome biogenesis GTPase Der [Thermoleophilia bacterium]
MGRVAVVGYPNVGKSTLVNRLSGTRVAIVHETPGVTRDRKDVPVEWNGSQFMLIDTGGVDQGDPRPMAKQIIEQVELAIAESDLILFLVDAKAGMTAADQELADLLRRRRVPTMLIANKIDNARDETLALEFHALALGDPLPVSGNHGNNTGDLLDQVVERLKDNGSAFDQQDDVIHIAVLGRPNVGKSTLVNSMLGNERVIVSEVAGTTRDAIDSQFVFEDREVVLVDTAGIRRRSRGGNDIDYYSEVRTLQAADRADVALLLVDASQGVRETDLSIADKIMERDCATIVVLSKWDINDCDLGDVKDMIGKKLRQRPEVVTASALTGRNVQKIMQKAIELHGRYSHRAGTGELNRLVGDLKQSNPPPMDRRTKRRLNMLYATQFQTAPPRIRIFVNDRKLVTRSYAYFMENQLREHFDFQGCPLIIDYMTRS